MPICHAYLSAQCWRSQTPSHVFAILCNSLAEKRVVLRNVRRCCSRRHLQGLRHSGTDLRLIAKPYHLRSKSVGSKMDTTWHLQEVTPLAPLWQRQDSGWMTSWRYYIIMYQTDSKLIMIMSFIDIRYYGCDILELHNFSWLNGTQEVEELHRSSGPRCTRLECICRAKRKALAKDLTRHANDKSRMGLMMMRKNGEEEDKWSVTVIILLIWLDIYCIYIYVYYMDVYKII